jgi:hypothetical protein
MEFGILFGSSPEDGLDRFEFLVGEKPISHNRLYT